MRGLVRATLVAVTAFATSTALVACGGPDEQPGGTESPKTRPTPAPPDYAGDPDAPPPLAFETEPVFTIPTGPLETYPTTLSGRAVWVADTGGMSMLDLADGKQIARLDAEHPLLTEPPDPEQITGKQAVKLDQRITKPRLVEIDDEPAVVTVVGVELENGKGFEVIAASAVDGKPIWRLPVDPYGEQTGDVGTLGITIVDETLAVQWTLDGNLAGAFAVDLERPEVRWQRDDFYLVDGYDETFYGFRVESDGGYAQAGIDRSDGQDVWTEPLPAGGWSAGASGGPWVELDGDNDKAKLIDIESGKTLLTDRDGLTSAMSCDQDEGSVGHVVLCASKRDGALALDTDSESGSESGSVDVLWHSTADEWNNTLGANYSDRLYVDTADGPAVLDAETGDVAGNDPGVVPDLVNPYGGLVFAGDEVEVYRVAK